jgi:hypothetical protein
MGVKPGVIIRDQGNDEKRDEPERWRKGRSADNLTLAYGTGVKNEKLEEHFIWKIGMEKTTWGA